MSSLPGDIANQALDACGLDMTIGDLTEGTRPAQVLLRAYGQCMRQLLRAANWSFSRREAPLLLLADATGQTANVGTIVPSGYQYSYAYPTDCARVRFIPWWFSGATGIPANNIQIPTTPLTTGPSVPPQTGQPMRTAKFILSNDPNFPPDPAQQWWEIPGVSPTGRVVILCNVQDANCVYTTNVFYPSMWDPLFRAALVAYLASEIALPLHTDKKLGLVIANRQVGIAKQKISEARAMDAVEGTPSSDIRVDWMDARRTGGYGSGYGYGCNDGGNYYGALGMCSFADGTTF